MPDISADGRYVAFEFDDRGDGMPFVAIMVHDRLTGATTRESGNWLDDSSFGPSLSSDGRYVAFTSFSIHLVAGDTNAAPDIFLRELAILPPLMQTYQSAGSYDGWVLESAENDEMGGRIDAGASTFFVGDASSDQQYRSILHFNTSSLPNNAMIAKVTLKIKKQGLVGTNPFNTHGSLLVDIRKPYFHTLPELQTQDFQAASDLHPAGVVQNVPGAIWYTATLDPAALPLVNLAGPTQLRLRFALDDNNDNNQDYLKFYSGNAASADQPVLTVEYYSSPAGSPVVSGVLRADPDPTSASSVHFTVAFSEPVTGVDAADFALTTTGREWCGNHRCGRVGRHLQCDRGNWDRHRDNPPGCGGRRQHPGWQLSTIGRKWIGEWKLHRRRDLHGGGPVCFQRCACKPSLLQ